MIGYNDKLEPARQVDMKEDIAALIYSFQEDMISNQDLDCDDRTLTDEDCNDLADLILYKVLREFRPDLFDDYTAL